MKAVMMLMNVLIVFSMGTLGHPIRSQRHNSSTVKKILTAAFLAHRN